MVVFWDWVKGKFHTAHRLASLLRGIQIWEIMADEYLL